MSDYLELTSDASYVVFRALSDMESPIVQLRRDLINLDRVEHYIASPSSSYDAEVRLRDYRDGWEQEPTLANVTATREWLEQKLLVRRRSFNVLCGTILMIAQNGLKLVIGPPSLWAAYKAQALTKKGESLLEEIWHGRNQATHVEGLAAGKETDRYFRGLELRYGPSFSTARNGEFIPELILRDVLGWIGLTLIDSERGSYSKDMLRVAQLFNR
jgi:hypothetical protein